jgi:hypothetical protein
MVTMIVTLKNESVKDIRYLDVIFDCSKAIFSLRGELWPPRVSGEVEIYVGEGHLLELSVFKVHPWSRLYGSLSAKVFKNVLF